MGSTLYVPGAGCPRRRVVGDRRVTLRDSLSKATPRYQTMIQRRCSHLLAIVKPAAFHRGSKRALKSAYETFSTPLRHHARYLSSISKESARHVLGLDPAQREIPWHALQRAYRKSVMNSHPDRGGTTDKFHRVQLAFKILEQESTPPQRPQQDGAADEAGPGVKHVDEVWLRTRIDELYDELDDLYHEKRSCVHDQRILEQKWNTAVDPDAAPWEERAWLRDDMCGDLDDTEERVRQIQEMQVRLHAELETLEGLVENFD